MRYSIIVKKAVGNTKVGEVKTFEEALVVCKAYETKGYGTLVRTTVGNKGIVYAS